MDGLKPIDDLGDFGYARDSSEKTVQILTNDEGNRRALSGLLTDHFDVLTAPDVREADLFVVDNQVMPTYYEPLREHVEASHPIFVPVVVIRRPDESRSIDFFEPIPSTGPILVDAELEAPITKPTLIRRVHSLLERRNQSINHRDREQRVKRLLEATRTVMNTDDRDDVIQFTADVTNNILGFSSTVIRILEDDTFVPRVVSESASYHMGSRPDYPLDPNDNPVARAFVRGEPMVYPNFDQLDDGYDRQSAASGMYAPIGDYGVLSVVETEVQAFDRSDVGFASVLAANATSALDRIEYEKRLQRRERTQQIVTRVLRHNIRNDLNTIMGYAEMLDEYLSGTATDRTQQIIESAEELLETSTNTRHISRYTGLTETSVRSLSSLVEESIEQVLENEPSVEIERELATPCPARVCEGFSLAVNNLLENAIQHNDSTNPLISVRIQCDDRPKVIVEDNGPGIPDTELKPLESDEERPLEHISGTGLWLVKILVENSDGDIAFEKTSNGTRVVMSLEPPTSDAETVY